MNMDMVIEYLCNFGEFMCLIGFVYWVGWCLYGK